MNIVKYKTFSIKGENLSSSSNLSNSSNFSKKQKIISLSLIGFIVISSLIISFFTTDKLIKSKSKYFNFLNTMIGKRAEKGNSIISSDNYGNTLGILWIYFSNLFITLFMVSILCFPQFMKIALMVIPIVSLGIIFILSKFYILFPFHHNNKIKKLKITNWISIGSMGIFSFLFLLNLNNKILSIIHTSIHAIILAILYYYGNYEEKPAINSNGPTHF